ncbi:MFS transporter [Streptomyces viridochromogenes]|uniref:MFS transporter n=1 Tax=Streptomyces viridochromogenes TaxID=1938 RepID=UPI00069FDA01|nr:MFS transporter [Streptomyces viridochromogenes]KOG21846.1 MFS transporter [Streptomyces viridochromogenes]KOG29783.1 MFS transporter [Streptomyces viridochromogenes]
MNPRLTLASSVVGAVIVALDGTVLTVAQPSLRRGLDASFAQVQWTSTGYLIAVASLLVFAGRLGDRYGHHRLFGIGMLGFGAASAGIAVAPGVGWVIGLRVVQGVFGALLQPATLGMLRAAFPPDRLRAPIAVRTAAIGVAAAAGPVVGGALVAGPGWRAVFLLNVVPALVLGLLALTVRPPRPPSPARLDLPGALLLAVALACLVHSLVALPGWAFTAATAAVTGVAFVRHERRAASPLLPVDVIGSVAVGSALGMLVAASAALSGALFVGTFLLQGPLGLDPFRSALVSLPLALLMVVAAPTCAVLLRRAGARRTTVAAMAVLALGILVLSRASAIPALCAGFALVGAGFGTVMVAATHVVVREAAIGSAGVAGGLQQTAMNVGPVLGVAAATALMGAGGGSGLPLGVFAALALAGVALGRGLPGRQATPKDDHGQSTDRTRVPARR